jgi:hypothetical protein
MFNKSIVLYYDWSKVKVEEIGASISGAWETINPLNWGW